MNLTHREALAEHAGLFEFPWTSELLHVSTEVTVPTLCSHTGLTALTPGTQTHIKHERKELFPSKIQL